MVYTESDAGFSIGRLDRAIGVYPDRCDVIGLRDQLQVVRGRVDELAKSMRDLGIV
jgi:hypothetical protein